MDFLGFILPFVTLSSAVYLGLAQRGAARMPRIGRQHMDMLLSNPQISEQRKEPSRLHGCRR